MILTGLDVKHYFDHGLRFKPEIMPDQFQQNGIDLILSEVEDKELSSGIFTLGRTREFITMPNDLMAFVELRSTWARKGFMIPPTIVDAGFKGTLTIEIVWFRRKQQVDHMVPPVGERFIHLIFAKTLTSADPYDGKYQGQIDITHAKDDIEDNKDAWAV
jgi:dCTP deaminase